MEYVSCPKYTRVSFPEDRGVRIGMEIWENSTEVARWHRQQLILDSERGLEIPHF